MALCSGLGELGHELHNASRPEHFAVLIVAEITYIV